MKKNTVIISIEEYNKLRDFKKEVEESSRLSKFAVIEEKLGSSSFLTIRKYYYTESEIVTEIEELNKKLEEHNKELEEHNKELEILVNDLKKMSYLKFCKWRKK